MKLGIFVANADDGGWPQQPQVVLERLPVPRAGDHLALPGDERMLATVVAVDWDFTADPPQASVLAYYDPAFTPAPGTCTITEQDVRELLSALEDAADYRRDQGESCGACDEVEGDGKCGDHSTDDSIASMYDMLGEMLAAKMPGATPILGDGPVDVTERVDPADG